MNQTHLDPYWLVVSSPRFLPRMGKLWSRPNRHELTNVSAENDTMVRPHTGADHGHHQGVPVSAVCFASPWTVVCGNTAAQMYVSQWTQQKCIVQLPAAHTRTITRLVDVPRARSMLSASRDGSVAITAVDGKTAVRVFGRHTTAVMGLALNPGRSPQDVTVFFYIYTLLLLKLLLL